MFSFSFNLGDISQEIENVERKEQVVTSELSSAVHESPSLRLPFVEVPCPEWAHSLISASETAIEAEVPYIELAFETSAAADADTSQGCNFILRKVDIAQHPTTLHTLPVPADHDIVPHRYGGGYKVWECSLDLVQFLLEERAVLEPILGLGAGAGAGADADATAPTGSVLELGCGHGLPGAAAISLYGPARAVFSDLNEEVLADTTWGNIALNGGLGPGLEGNSGAATRAAGNCRIQCVAGDWGHLSSWLGSDRFDLVLSAETLYNEENCISLVQLLVLHLARTGVAYFATKRYYFGVGGGTEALGRAVKASGEALVCSVVRRIEDGSSNIRDIVQVRWQS
jgi:hypothetical protein